MYWSKLFIYNKRMVVIITFDYYVYEVTSSYLKN